MVDARVTQNAVEVIEVPSDMEARVTQNVIEDINSGNPTARVTQCVIEVIILEPSDMYGPKIQVI